MRVVLLSGLILSLIACGSVKDANKSNFRKAIQAYLDTQPGLCAVISVKEMPFTLSSSSFGFDVSSQRANALVDAGLLSKKDTQAKADFGNKVVPAVEYQITTAGQKARVENATDSLFKQNTFCTGKYVVVDIDNFTEPSNMMGMTVTEVRFRYKVDNPSNWAKTKSLRAIFNNFEKETQGDMQGRAALVLTNNGWMHERLFAKQ
jgi:hypothetical protein